MSTNSISPRTQAINDAKAVHRQNALMFTTPKKHFKFVHTEDVAGHERASSGEFTLAPEYPLEQHSAAPDKTTTDDGTGSCTLDDIDLSKTPDCEFSKALKERDQAMEKLRNLEVNTYRVDFRSANKDPLAKAAGRYDSKLMNRVTADAQVFVRQWSFLNVAGNRIQTAYEHVRPDAVGETKASNKTVSDASIEARGAHMFQVQSTNNTVTLYDSCNAVNNYNFFRQNHGNIHVQNNTATTSFSETPPEPRSFETKSSAAGKTPQSSLTQAQDTPSWYQESLWTAKLGIRTAGHVLQLGFLNHGIAVAAGWVGMAVMIPFMSMPQKGSSRVFMGLAPLALTGFLVLGGKLSEQAANGGVPTLNEPQERGEKTVEEPILLKSIIPGRPTKLENPIKVTSWPSGRRFCVLSGGEVKNRRGGRAGFHQATDEVRSERPSARRYWAKEISAHEMLDRLIRVFQIDQAIALPLWKVDLGSDDGSCIELWRDDPSPVMREHGELYIQFTGTEQGMVHAEALLTFLLSEELDW